jgi:hypothetical protein
MTQQLWNDGSGGFYENQGSNLINPYLEGMGQATRNLQLEGNFCRIDNGVFNNATGANIYLATGQSSIFKAPKVFNYNQVMQVPPPYLVDNETNDNQFIGGVLNGALTAGIFDNAGGGTLYTGVHIFQVFNGPSWRSNISGTLMSNCYCDNIAAGYAGVELNGNGGGISNLHVKVTSYAGQYGVLIKTGSINNAISNVNDAQARITLANLVVQQTPSITNAVSNLPAVAPTITSGLGTSPTVTTISGTRAFQLTVGAAGSPTTTTVLGMPQAATGWCVTAQDMTTAVTARQTATSTTSVTLTWSSAPSNSDVIVCQAQPF